MPCLESIFYDRIQKYAIMHKNVHFDIMISNCKFLLYYSGKKMMPQESIFFLMAASIVCAIALTVLFWKIMDYLDNMP